MSSDRQILNYGDHAPPKKGTPFGDPKKKRNFASKWIKEGISFANVVWSLDIFGHWNAKRSSRPYLMYWALNVGWPAFEMVFLIGGHGRRQWAGANWRFRRSQKNQVKIRASRREARLLLVIRSR
ncbi:hypothetical protein TNCV_2789331 [Trichonephila clavipes]|nr:hypothetical protein TNCV_2789331 [Trichonephila clavipes]